MKKIFIFVILTLLCSFGIASAAGMFGAPEGASRPYMALGYSYEQNGMKMDDGPDFIAKQNQMFLQGGYGWSGSEVYMRLGFSDLRVQPNDMDNTFSDSYQPYGAIGAKYFSRINEAWGIGPFIQATYYFSDFSQYVNSTNVSVKNWWDTSIGFGVQYKVASSIAVYAGPFISWSNGKLYSNDVSTDFESNTNFGAYLGATGKVNDKVSVTAEGKYTDYFSGGLMVNYSF